MSKTDHDKKRKGNEADAPDEILDPEIIDDHEGHEVGEEELEGEALLELLHEQLDDRYRRALADFQNFQRRSIENEQRAREYGSTEILKSLIPVLDNCQLALHMNPETVTAEQVLVGVKGIVEQFFTSLAKHGVAPVEPKQGDEFDPERHEAMLRTETDEVEPGRIVQVLQLGYELNGRVVRPAQVSVRPQEDGA